MMAHYALLDEDNVVTEVIVGVHESQLIEGKDPETWYGEFRGQVCKRTSYNTQGGQHPKGRPFRKNYAGIGFTYDEDRDAFIPPKPYDSWTLNEDTCLWDAPVPYPDDGGLYTWDEDAGDWVEMTLP